jgi:hypothetical protein
LNGTTAFPHLPTGTLETTANEKGNLTQKENLMTSLREVSTMEFRESLTPSAVRVSQVIYFALAAGAALFMLIVIVLYFQHSDGEVAGENYSLLNTLTIVHTLFAILMWTFSRQMFERQFSDENLGRAGNETFADKTGSPIILTPAQQCMSVIRTASLVRLATLNGTAFFGLVISILAVTNGSAQNKPVYLLNMASAALFIIYVAATFPNAERLEAIFEKYIHR